MNILVVGAGSIGKVYGYHLHKGGAHVSFFVKEKHHEEAKSGFRYYPLNDKHGRSVQRPSIFTQYGILTKLHEVQREKWDYIVLAMSSPALRSGWLDSFLSEIGNATVVSLQPGMEDRAYLKDRLSFRHLIEGTIHILSYEAPLPNGLETIAGTAYWAPPGSHAAFSGPSDRLNPLLSLFRQSRFAVKAVPDTRKLNILANPLLTLFVMCLEHVGWSFRSLKRSSLLHSLCLALPEAVAIQAFSANAKTPFLAKHLRPWLIYAGLSCAKLLVPFDLETYLEVHFTKVWGQMTEHLEQLLALGKQNGFSVEYLERFRSELRAG